MKMKETRKLPSERNNPTVERRVLAAAHTHFHKRKGIRAVFEHGHWWIVLDSGKIYDVVDAEGYGSINGFGFEGV